MAEQQEFYRSEYQLQALKIPAVYRKYCTPQAVDIFRCFLATKHNVKACENQKVQLDNCMQKYILHTRNNNLIEMYVRDPKKFEAEHVADDLFTVQNKYRALKGWFGYNLH